MESYHQDLPANYEISTSYVRYRKPSPDEMKQKIDYNLDEEDEIWLHEFHKKHTMKIMGGNKNDDYNTMAMPLSPRSQNMPRSPGLSSIGITSSIYPNLTPNSFEIMIDVLEKETKFDAIPSFSQAHILFMENIPLVFYTKLPKASKTGSSMSTTFKSRSSSSHSTSSSSSSSLSWMTPKKAKFISEQVYQYWVNKRCKLKKPLLRTYWPVTASNDTNPHLVFRPREKEKYKLRKKRQNDIDAYRKMQQLKLDYDKIRVLLKFVVDRELLLQLKLKIQEELFDQRLYDCVDTSGYPRTSKLNEIELREKLSVPRIPPWIEKFHSKHEHGSSKRKAKRRRNSANANHTNNVSENYQQGDINIGNNLHNTSMSANGTDYSTHDFGMGSNNDQLSEQFSDHHDASQNYNNTVLPPLTSDYRNVPLFTHPLPSREKFVNNWEKTVPFVSSYVNGDAAPTYPFKHRGRIGRGGRIVIDRLPYCVGQDSRGNDLKHNIVIVGEGSSRHQRPKPKESKTKSDDKSAYASSARGLLDLLPSKKLDYEQVSQKIKEIVAGYVSEEENDHEHAEEAIIVRTDDWLSTDIGSWGEEKYSIGPL